MLVQDILTRINNHFDDWESPPVYKESVKISWIDSAQKDLAGKLSINLLQKLVNSVLLDSIQSTTGSALYDLPATTTTDFLKMVEVVYKGVPCRPIKLVQRALINQNMDYMPSETAPIGLIREKQVEIFPSSGPVVEDSVEIIYVKRPITLGILTDIIQLDDYSELMFNYAIAQGYGRDNQPEGIQYLNLYIQGLMELMGVK